MRRLDVTERLVAVQASRSPAELIEALDDPSPDVARAAIARLAELGRPDAVRWLRARLLSSDVSIVAEIAGAFHAAGDPAVVDLAIAGLGGEPYTRRLTAARVLAAIGDRRAADALRAAVHDSVAGVRVAVLDALGQLGPSETSASECAPLLADPDPHVRLAAIRAVARTSRRPGTHLSGAARDPDRVARLEVARHLAALDDQSARALLTDEDLRVREAAARGAGLRHVGQLAVMLVEDPSSDVRHAAARVLGELGDNRLAELLLPGLEDRDAVVRVSAARAIERLLTPAGAIARLRRELGASDPRRRSATVYALARMRAADAAEDVRRLVADDDVDVRLALIHTAEELQANPESLVRRLTMDDDGLVRHSAEVWLLHSRERARTTGSAPSAPAVASSGGTAPSRSSDGGRSPSPHNRNRR
jgi:HEAT repeat protein